MITQHVATRPKTAWRWHEHTFRAMNTTVLTRLYSQTEAAVLPDVERLFSSFEKRLSRFDPASELSRLNGAEKAPFWASPTLLDAVEVALVAAESTGGLYDPTILGLLEAAGYDRSFEQVSQPTPLAALPPVSSPESQLAPHRRSFTYRSVRINRARREIYKPAGLRLDLGGMGKGWTVDRAADRLQGLGPFLINAGGDIFAYQSPPGQKGWAIDLTDPLDPERTIGALHLHHRALATSTIARRRWQRQGTVMHHVIDPRTGRPAQTDALSVSVVADRTVMAEIYAKVALILGVKAGLAYLNNLPRVEGLIYTADAAIETTPGMARLMEAEAKAEAEALGD